MLLISAVTFRAFAWSEHPLLVYPALKNHPVWEKLPAVEAVSLKNFLLAAEKELESFMAQQEAWSTSNLPNYAPCPAELHFRATGNPQDILDRFFSAIRINPNAKIPLYLHVITTQKKKDGKIADPREITTLSNISVMKLSTYYWLDEGERVLPFEVLTTASDEPDYGFDLGLFEDNHTDYGKRYGFGLQSFGNPNLEYSSQAPFHMGFFHEAKILYSFGPFLKRTYMDYRIFLYKALSEFAFRNNQPYWGWRFMGWGMHYVGDVSMPYHMRPLPGVRNSRMLWINMKSVMGASRARDHAVQLVSNRHTVFEELQLQILRKAYLTGDFSHPFFTAFENPGRGISYSQEFLMETATRESTEKSKEADRVIQRNVPFRMVSDPLIEVSDLPEMPNLVEVVRSEMGDDALEQLTGMIADCMQSFAIQVYSYMDSVLESLEKD